MKHFAIIGNPLRQSFSARYFSEKFLREHIDADYTLCPLSHIQEVEEFFLRDNLVGLNVTIPYKIAVIPYLTRLDATAEAIGAVNVIRIKGDERIGYNTDCLGFIDSLRPHLLPSDRQALVLGTGGASRAICYGLRQLGLTPTLVSRSAERGITYDALREQGLSAYDVIVNCTPLGMFPDVETCPDIDYNELSPHQLLYDCVYNPDPTLFLRRGAEQGCRTVSGVGMLYGQAEAAWKIWNE